MIQVPQATQAQLHPWIRSNPMQELKKLERQALAWNVLSKITFVAITAICFSVLAASFALGSATAGAVPFALVGLILSTPFLAYGSSKCQARGKELERQAEMARSIVEQYKTIRNWNDEQIRAFYQENGIALQENLIDPIPLRTLLPLIARFKARMKDASDAIQVSHRMLVAAELHHHHQQGWKYSDLLGLRTSSRHIGWQKLESEALPAALEAALIFQILSTPRSGFCQYQLHELGSIRKKTFEERQFDRLYGPDDHYFIFRERGRAPLTLRELLETNLSPRLLREKLFLLPAPIA